MAVRHRSGGKTFGGENVKPLMDDLGYGDSGSAARFFYCAKASRKEREMGCEGMDGKTQAERTGRQEGSPGLVMPGRVNNPYAGNSGVQVQHNHHPTVKPLAIMRYLCRLVTPPNGLVLDPFMGSGSTGKAAVLEGFGFVGIDNVPEYVEIARRRIEGTAPLFAERVLRGKE
jgi:site-specific DNA-methyltransferase (adenine-specific)